MLSINASIERIVFVSFSFLFRFFFVSLLGFGGALFLVLNRLGIDMGPAYIWPGRS